MQHRDAAGPYCKAQRGCPHARADYPSTAFSASAKVCARSASRWRLRMKGRDGSSREALSENATRFANGFILKVTSDDRRMGTNEMEAFAGGSVVALPVSGRAMPRPLPFIRLSPFVCHPFAFLRPRLLCAPTRALRRARSTAHVCAHAHSETPPGRRRHRGAA